MNKCNHPRHISTGDKSGCNIYLQSMSKEQVLAIADSKTSTIAKNIDDATFNNLYKTHYEDFWFQRKLLIAPLILKRTILTIAYVAFCIFMSVIFAPACTLTFLVIRLFKTLVNIPMKGLQKSWEDQMKGFRSRELKIILEFYSELYRRRKPTLWELGIILAHIVLLFRDREGLKLIQRLTLIKDSYDKENIIKMFNCYEASKTDQELSIKDRAQFTLAAFQLGGSGKWQNPRKFVEAVYDKNFKNWEHGKKTTQNNKQIDANYIIQYFNEILPPETKELERDEIVILRDQTKQLRSTYLEPLRRYGKIEVDEVQANDPLSTVIPEKNFRQTVFSKLSSHVINYRFNLIDLSNISDLEGTNTATLIIKNMVLSYASFDDVDLVHLLGEERAHVLHTQNIVIPEEVLQQRKKIAFKRIDIIFKNLEQHEKNYCIALFHKKIETDHTIGVVDYNKHNYTRMCPLKGPCFYEKLVSYLLPQAPLGLVFDKTMNKEIWDFFWVYYRNATFRKAPKDIKIYILSLIFTSTFNNPGACSGVHSKLKTAVKFPDLKLN